MVSNEVFKELALSFNGVEQAPHFHRVAFKITARRIFATLLGEASAANIFLSLNEGAIYTAYEKDAVYAVPNKWGLQGWTTFELARLPAEFVQSALHSAYNHVLQSKPKKKGRQITHTCLPTKTSHATMI